MLINFNNTIFFFTIIILYISLACADSRCGLCDASITECTKCKAGFSLMLDAANISTECVRYCPKDYVMQKINGASTCIKEQEKGIKNNLFKKKINTNKLST